MYKRVVGVGHRSAALYAFCTLGEHISTQCAFHSNDNYDYNVATDMPNTPTPPQPTPAAPDTTHNDALLANTRQLIKANSFSRNFALAIVRGIGVTLGATIITGLLLAVIYNIYTSSIGTVPFLNNIIPQSEVEKYMNPK